MESSLSLLEHFLPDKAPFVGRRSASLEISLLIKLVKVKVSRRVSLVQHTHAPPRAHAGYKCSLQLNAVSPHWRGSRGMANVSWQMLGVLVTKHLPSSIRAAWQPLQPVPASCRRSQPSAPVTSRHSCLAGALERQSKQSGKIEVTETHWANSETCSTLWNIQLGCKSSKCFFNY